LRQCHAFEHRFPLIRSLRESAQRSTSVLFSFVISLVIVAGSFTAPQSENDSSAILWSVAGILKINSKAVRF
jgi:hypothetical protein